MSLFILELLFIKVGATLFVGIIDSFLKLCLTQFESSHSLRQICSHDFIRGEEFVGTVVEACDLAFVV